MDKWEYAEFAEVVSYTEEWIEFLNKKGSEGWELISYNEKPYEWDKNKVYRKCIFKRKI